LDPKGAAGRILLVDDLAIYRRVVPARLGALGRDIDAVANVDEARTYLAKRKPEIVLLDVIMPGVDGFTYCRELKADPKTRDIPVLMLTDLKGNAHERSLEAGADDYMPKRIDDAVFRIRVQLHLHLQELRRRDGGAKASKEPCSILLATKSPLLRAQLPAQFGQDGHSTRMVDKLEDVLLATLPQDRLIILDMDLGIDEMHSAVAQIRMDPSMSGMAIVLLCEKEELTNLLAIEFMVDDVIWKPLKAQVTRHRVEYLLELARRSFKD
jgi:DNA-binding response OmpR family regulator